MDYVRVPFDQKSNDIRIASELEKYCYWVKPINPKYELEQTVRTINSEKGTIVDVGRNELGNIYRVLIGKSENKNDPFEVDIQEEDLNLFD